MSQITLAEQATPATPASTTAAVYFKSDGLMYWIDDAGVERAVSFTGGAGTFTDLTVTGNTILGNASGDTFTINAAAWTLGNAATVTGTWANLGTVTTVDINDGTIDATAIGGTTPAAGAFTTLSATGAITQGANSADSGAFRLPNAAAITWRRANNLANDMELSQDSSNNANLVIQAGTQFNFKIGSTTYLSASSTGLAVTGAISSTTINVGAATNANSRPWAFAGFGTIEGANGNGFDMLNTSTGNRAFFTLESGDIQQFNASGGQAFLFGGNKKLESLSIGVGVTGVIQGAEQAAPAAPAANGYRIFAQDNGAGKTQLMVIFASGAAQQIAIEP